MLWRPTYNPTPYDDDWEDQPAQGAFYQWICGAIVPLSLIAYGAYTIVIREARYGRVPMKLVGSDAVAFGIAAISAGVFIHCHYFWGNIYNQAWIAVLGKILSALAFIVSLGTVIMHVLIYGA